MTQQWLDFLTLLFAAALYPLGVYCVWRLFLREGAPDRYKVQAALLLGFWVFMVPILVIAHFGEIPELWRIAQAPFVR
jgi:hypothetical protein